ncbi:hypothetical protein Glove_161g40 [Diversispora epigaea]|uniref:Uncharacterized protein n=1 Tax=Diversispora epigaea TaxID=1348612 RepID=A0A397IW08_9GLOM|nr:hypothetical protein Glove_161g40 [Diversispora epigaea]
MFDRVGDKTIYLDLVLKEDYIKFLEKEILIRDKELDPLHQQISDIKSRLKKVLQTSISQEKYIDYLEEQLVLEEQNTNMTNLDPIIQIDRGLNRIENHLRGVETPLNNPINIINGIRGSLNAVQHNYQSAYQDGITLQNYRHISSLLYKQFALQLLNRRTTQQLERQLQQYQVDKRLLEYDRNRLFDRYYNKFKNYKTNPKKHIEKFKLWLVGSGIDVGVGHANRINAHGVFITSLKAIQLGAQALNWANGQVSDVVISAYTVFDEDWSFVDRRPTDRLPNAPNANVDNTIVVPGIRLRQVLYWFKTNYPTVTAKKQ